MTRRQFLASVSVAAAPVSRPNVLFLSVDDMNDWVGCLGGYNGVQTPNIDRLAKRGALFANAHCASPLCNPSRTALLTGQRPSTTGMYNNDQFWRPNLPNAVTLPMHFKANGYHVAGAGKVFHHTAGNNPPSQWDEVQLQVFDDPWYRRADWYPWNKRVPAPAGHPFNGLRNFQGEFDWGVIPAAEREYGDQRAVDFGLNFLSKSHEKPFFLAVGLWHPHIPMFAPQKYFDLYPPEKVKIPYTPAGDLDDVPKTGQEWAAARRDEHNRIVREGKWRDAVRAYLAAITFADAMIGRLLDGLETSAHANNTVVVFWSDNGWHLGEKDHWHKSTLWQRATHVPLIIAGPGVRQPGISRKQAVSLLDLYPTLTDLCRLPQRKECEGRSLVPQLQDAAAPRPPAVIDYLPGNHAVRDVRYRYIRYRDGSEELYDEQADPEDWRNLASDPKYATLKQNLAKWIPTKSAPPKPERTEFDFDFDTYTYKRK
ncbi:MAG TPA: sulfatase [Bryobacteraceae bacterium]|nr:sulfatase [Bryobacteraceae bacterium]